MNGWLFLEEKALETRNWTVRLSFLTLCQIDDGRGWRFSEEQAETLSKLVENLIKHVKVDTKKRNEERKRFIKIPFFKFKVSMKH